MKYTKQLCFLVAFLLITISLVASAQYFIIKYFSITINSSPFYFDAYLENNEITSTASGIANINLIIKNFNAENYNNFSTDYKITINENSKYTLSLDGTTSLNTINETIIGESAQSQTLSFKLLQIENQTYDITESITLKISSTSPYKKEIDLPITIYNDYNIVTVTSKSQLIGSYFEYPVEYKDAYGGGFEFTSTNGWRILDYSLDTSDDRQKTIKNVKIISTGLAARLYYYYNNTTNATWWDTTYLQDFYNNVLGGSSFGTYNLTSSDYTGIRAASGLYHNFEKIKFKYSSSSRGYNLGYFIQIKNAAGTTYNSSNTTEVTGADLFLSDLASSVRIFTLPEVNTANGNAINHVSTSGTTSTYIRETTGLYRLEALSIKNSSGTTKTPYSSQGRTWIASPYPPSYETRLTYMDYDGRISYGNNYDLGVRPVITLKGSLHLIEQTASNGEKYYTIAK